ncbi:hypothetical protein [Wohlfahrtiimonas chitiniclastica]|uniref:hypothetical protein n=1 Tax=Wohlfahrtiimonas chitiniclastica TaxID=400946 RepID=UPI0007B699F6|nr:hypothetical protein [Wohlfahrtiimonas chitiniclastica]KZX37242.1 hypothetical protein A6V30_10175 [Wohlfahrtiimonas chitiniclastica]KZX37262.1 hypothetical protein A6V30_10280 [Wohlfahrtiimonas chitiniclastica]
MAIVSISEAARLTGKTRATIHRHINTGKLSKTKNDTGSIGIDTSDTCIDTVKIEQRDTDELNTLKIRLEVLEAENHHLKDHVDSLKQVMLMLEHREQKQEKSSSWLSRLFNK